ncbi:putative AAP1-alanine/arginine aminopeptidase [Tilletiaria anomala UBC 951]|uniref:Putative AAP1-alanine/arginine aminopeptidase n=1 Tax=Tilletiaria anomala (strain ATCC 24038 / CBS 436.72 / UBC 951) TaxID=1037660 RepID=A0A066VUW4_TILAU|nr:putative AAP1-alanine/arginine aminopeptidase [Tilletiaria anomala UBC 951]KDN42604.1 putative AAP1-alanine/arginine aminopeptidase [Tilletiaria anomala UBC 951]
MTAPIVTFLSTPLTILLRPPSVRRLLGTIPQRSATVRPGSTTAKLYAAAKLTTKTPASSRVTQLNNQLRAHSSRAALASSSSSSSQPDANMGASAGKDGTQWHRLPTAVTPEHYDIIIKSDLEALTFTGLVTITLNIEEETDVITLNVGPKLTLSKAHITSSALKTDSKTVAVLEHDKEHERAVARLGQKLPKGSQATISIAYGSEIDNSMMGYYRSTWEFEGKKGFYALTQFEPTAARRAFPGFDEPGLKATYSFRMVHRKDTTALANMPAVGESKAISVAEQDKLLRTSELELDTSNNKCALKTESSIAGKTETDGDWVLTAFEKIPKVSSYLVAWANGPFVHLESTYKSPITGKDVQLRIYATGEYIDQAQFALDAKAKVMPVYEKVFDIAFPLPKLDTLVATDFDAGAMENWGLITGRTGIYLYDSNKGGLQAKKLSAKVQSHECAHQWFGNITTMDWWSGLWLNESFATLMGEVIILDRVWPEWTSGSEFIVGHLARALELDAKRSSHPIEVPLQGDNVESAINQVFDAISYSKGASVLRMLSRMVGEEKFLKGVSIYLKKHLYANATTNDLWKGISEASGLDIPKIMGKWVLQQGFPVLTVTEGENEIKVRQNRFLSTGDAKPEEDETLWYVPLELKTIGADGRTQVDSSIVLNEQRETSIPLQNVQGSVWKLNADTVGVYRVAYTPERLAKLGEAAKKEHSAFSLEDRVGLVNDAHTLAKAGYAQTSGTLTLLQKIVDEPTFLVNSSAIGAIGDLLSVWFEEPEDVQQAIQSFGANFFGPKAKRLGFDGKPDDSVETQQLRETVIAGAAAGRDEWTLGEIKRRFDAFLQGDDSLIPADLMMTIYSTSVRYGGEAEYNKVVEVYRKPPTQTHKQTAMFAMCATQQPELIERTIEFLYSGEVKEQDFLIYFRGLSARPVTRRLLWEATKKRFDELVERFSGNFALGRLVELSFGSFSSDKDVADVEAFFKGRDTRKYSMALSQGLEGVRARAAWLARDRDDVSGWLRKNGYLKQ